ncbi:hypothetical protein RUND412_005553 [Rhizina undulata]
MASQAGAQAARKAINPAYNPRTVHFWAPILKWSLVIAGIGDFYRPVDQLSVTQNAALFCTGAIWTRWCLIISPKNIPWVSRFPLLFTRSFSSGIKTYAICVMSNYLTRTLLSPPWLAAVNFFLAGVGTVQLSRIFLHQQQLKKEGKTSPILEEVAKSA